MGVDPAALNKGCPAVTNGGSCPQGGCTFTGRIDSRAAAVVGSAGGEGEDTFSFCATCTLKTPGATSCDAFARNGGSSVGTVERGGEAGGAPPLGACDSPSSSTVASASLIEEKAAAARLAGSAADDGRRAQRMRRRLQATSAENIDANGES